MTEMLYPGQTLGFIGGGENGIALLQEADQMGFRTVLYTDNENDPALTSATMRMVGSMHDFHRLTDFAKLCDCVVYDGDVIDAQVIADLSGIVSIPQGADVLSLTQDRYLEKVFLNDLNMNVAPYESVVNSEDIRKALDSIGYPSVLKPIQKGIHHNPQRVIYTEADIPKQADDFQYGTYLLEAWIPNVKELSVMLTKDGSDHLQCYPIVENVYDDHKLMASLAPARIDSAVAKEIQRIAVKIGDALTYTGLFGVEFYLTKAGTLYVKRVFAGPYLSGNVWHQANDINQYARHLRAICGWPLPTVQSIEPAICLSILQRFVKDSYLQIQIKPNWYFHYFQNNTTNPLPAERRVGQIMLHGPNLDQLIREVYATNLWEI